MSHPFLFILVFLLCLESSFLSAPDLAPANAGEVVETRPQVDANAPSQLIREICNRVSYPRASKSTSRANPGVAEKHTTPAHARQAVAQGKGVAEKESNTRWCK
jgi:hypothetical protein